VRPFNLRILLVLSLGHLVTDIYQGALPAILPFLKEQLALSYTMAGVILMTANFTSSVVQPIFGYWSDRQKKPILLPAGCLLAALGFSLLSLAPGYGPVLMLVTLSGLGIASYHPEGYKTAHFFTGERKVTGMSLFSVGGQIGFALGPLLAFSIIGSIGFAGLPLLVAPSLLFIAVMGLSWKRIARPDSHRKTAEPAAPPATARPVGKAALSGVLAFTILRSWMQMGLVSYIPFYYIDYLKWDPLRAGQLISTLLVGSVFGTLAGGPMADRWGHRKYLILTTALAAVSAPAVLMAEGWTLLILLFWLGMLVGSTFSVTIVMAQQLMPGRLGVTSGMVVGFAMGAGGLCVTLLGVIADLYGVPTAFQSVLFLPVAGFLVSLAIRYPERAPGVLAS
jgi:MFS transporter, FSR family, fosmidomycin resistance protein